MARAIRALLSPTTMPEVFSPAPQVGCAWRQLPNGQYVLGLLNYGEAPVQGIFLQGVGAAPELHFHSFEQDNLPLKAIRLYADRWQLALPPLVAEGFVTEGAKEVI